MRGERGGAMRGRSYEGGAMRGAMRGRSYEGEEL